MPGACGKHTTDAKFAVLTTRYAARAMPSETGLNDTALLLARFHALECTPSIVVGKLDARLPLASKFFTLFCSEIITAFPSC